VASGTSEEASRAYGQLAKEQRCPARGDRDHVANEVEGLVSKPMIEEEELMLDSAGCNGLNWRGVAWCGGTLVKKMGGGIGVMVEAKSEGCCALGVGLDAEDKREIVVGVEHARGIVDGQKTDR
jgi:hypothetical protein